MSGLLGYNMRKTENEIIGSSGLSTVGETLTTSCDTIPDSVAFTADGLNGLMMITPSPDGYHGQLVFDANGDPMVMVHQFGKKDETDPAQFLCEKDESWTCPEGAIMFQQLCYQLYDQEVSKAEAEIICLQNGANLLHVETRMQHTFITAAFPASDHNHTQIWLDIEKEVDNPVDMLYKGPHGSFDFEMLVDYTSTPQLSVPGENCVVMDAQDADVTNAFKKVSCLQTASFICESRLVIDPQVLKIMPKPQILMPLDITSGVHELAYPARLNVDSLLAVTDEAVPQSGLIGAGHFMGSALSYIDVENAGTDKEMKSSFGISIAMWTYIDKIFDLEIQMLVDTREECLDGSAVSEGFKLFLTKEMPGTTMDPFENDVSCGQLYNDSMADIPAFSETGLLEVRLNAEICSIQTDKSILCTRIASSETIAQAEWVHLGFTFDDVTKRGTFFVGETFGYHDLINDKTHRVDYFEFDTNGWWSERAVGTVVRIGAAKFQAPQGQKNFAGKISCLQVYEGPLTLPQFITLAKCPLDDGYLPKAQLCPDGFDHYKGFCYMLSEKEEEFASAEAVCTSAPGTKLRLFSRKQSKPSVDS